jgi:hypothetical protein
LQNIYKYFIEITFPYHFGLFNTLFHAYPTTARMTCKFAHSGKYLRLSHPDRVILKSIAVALQLKGKMQIVI